MIRPASLALLALLLSVLPVSAQDRPLTLQEAILRAQTQGPDASIARLDRQQATANFDVYQAQNLPRLSLNGSAPGLERSISNVQQDDGSVRYVEQSRTFSRAEFELAQAIPWTGGRFLVSSGLSRVNQFGNRQFSQWQSSPVSIGLEQPLFQYNQLKWNRRVEPLRYRVAERRLDADLAEVAVETARSYFNVYIAEINRDIADFNVAVNDTIFGLSQGRYEIGRIAENELLESELALLNAQSARSQAALALEEARRELRQTLGLPDTAAVPIDPPTRIPPIDVDPNAAVAQASRNRADLLELRLDRAEARENVARAKSQSGFSANVSARFGLNQSAEALGDAYTNPLNQQRFGITFQMPLYNWGQGRARVAAAEAARERTRQSAAERRKELEREVYIEARQLEQLEQQARIAATADTVATRRFEVARNRYTVGQIAITDLFDAQRQKDQARRAYLQTLRDFWVSYYRLRRLTLHDLVNDTPLQRAVAE
jgi:outer membrane protein TolC